MFTGFYSRKISGKSLKEVSESLSFIGVLKHSSSKEVHNYYDSKTFYNHKTEVKAHRDLNNQDFIYFTYSFNPSLLSWLLGICFFPFGFLIFLISIKAKDEFEDLLRTIEF